MLISAVQQCESAVCIHSIFPPGLNSVLYNDFLLAICFTHGNVHMSVLLSLSHPLLYLLCLQVHSLHANRFISIVILDSIYVC